MLPPLCVILGGGKVIHFATHNILRVGLLLSPTTCYVSHMACEKLQIRLLMAYISQFNSIDTFP